MNGKKEKLIEADQSAKPPTELVDVFVAANIALAKLLEEYVPEAAPSEIADKLNPTHIKNTTDN